jgi:hypothetical protein
MSDWLTSLLPRAKSPADLLSQNPRRSPLPRDGTQRALQRLRTSSRPQHDDLIKKLGPDWVFLGDTLDKALRCTECDNLGATVQVDVLDTERSRFAE